MQSIQVYAPTYAHRLVQNAELHFICSKAAVKVLLIRRELKSAAQHVLMCVSDFESDYVFELS